MEGISPERKTRQASRWTWRGVLRATSVAGQRGRTRRRTMGVANKVPGCTRRRCRGQSVQCVPSDCSRGFHVQRHVPENRLFLQRRQTLPPTHRLGAMTAAATAGAHPCLCADVSAKSCPARDRQRCPSLALRVQGYHQEHDKPGEQPTSTAATLPREVQPASQHRHARPRQLHTCFRSPIFKRYASLLLLPRTPLLGASGPNPNPMGSVVWQN